MRIILVLMLVMGLCGVVRGEDYTDQVVKYHHCNCGFQTAYSAGVRAIICPRCGEVWTKQFEDGYWYNRSYSQYAVELIEGLERYGTKDRIDGTLCVCGVKIKLKAPQDYCPYCGKFWYVSKAGALKDPLINEDL